ncbi:MAG: transglutaminase domain-containing protein [Clostridiaceae bacterium]
MNNLFKRAIGLLLAVSFIALGQPINVEAAEAKKVIQAQSLKPISCVDTPVVNQKVYKGDNIKFGGWALNTSGIKYIKLMLNGKFIGNPKYGLERVDVYKAYPQYKNTKSGFSYTFNSSGLNPGTYTFELQFIGKNGYVDKQLVKVVILEKLQRLYDTYEYTLKKALRNYQLQFTLDFTPYYNGDPMQAKIISEELLKRFSKVFYEEKYKYYTFLYTTMVIKKEANNKFTLVNNLQYNDIHKKTLSPEQMKKWEAAAMDRAKKISANVIKPGMSTEEKIRVLHDYLINHASYDTSVINNDGKDKQENHIDYGVLVKGVGTCESYAKAFSRLMTVNGIDSKEIVGTINGFANMWNLVKVNNVWRHVDVTFDDIPNSPPDYRYFLKVDTYMRIDHNWDATKYPACN